MPTTAAEIRAAVEERFAPVARSPEQEWKFPVGPASAKKLGYDPQEIDALPPNWPSRKWASPWAGTTVTVSA